MPKPTVPEVLPLVQAVYESHLAGCCLHIVLDDLNVDDASVDLCARFARENEHERCLKLAELMRRMSKTQRRELSSRR